MGEGGPARRRVAEGGSARRSVIWSVPLFASQIFRQIVVPSKNFVCCAVSLRRGEVHGAPVRAPWPCAARGLPRSGRGVAVEWPGDGRGAARAVPVLACPRLRSSKQKPQLRSKRYN